MIYQLSLLPNAFYSFFRKIAGIALFLHRVRLAVKHLIEDTDKAAELVKQAWVLFTELVNKQHKTGVWRIDAIALGVDNWNDYCKAKWGKGATRISQFNSALPYAEKLASAGIMGTLEATIRKIKKARIPADSPLLAASYELALEVAKEKGRAPTEAMFKRAHEILVTAENTGYVNVGDIDIPIKDVASAVFAVKSTMQEAQKTALEGKSVPVKCKARRCGDYWMIEADGNLPDEYFEFTTYIKG